MSCRRKIGILTFHFARNYGAVLQCYALTRYLQKQGHDAAVIDYQPKYHTIRFAAHKPPFAYACYRWNFFRRSPLGKRADAFVKGYREAVEANRTHRDDKVLQAFADFRETHLNCTRRYATYAELKEHPPEADAYIVGSDQVWNPDILDQKLDPAYFAAFGKTETKRIAYAVSLGRDLVGRELIDLRRYCADMDAISIRERSETAVEAMQRDVHVCLDPTLLLDAADYAEAEAAPTETEPYIFVYGFQTNEATKHAVELAKARYGCKVLNGSPLKIHLDGAETVYDYGPSEFLTYLKNAACVVTNSFHGTALSLIYEKDFITIAHTLRPTRMVELLKKLELSYRLCGDESFSFDRPIDYDAVQSRIAAYRAASETYLSMALDGVRGEDIPHGEID